MDIAIGDKLFSSCAAEFYGEIIGIGEDANHVPTIDIRVNDANDLIVKDTTDDDNEPDPEWPEWHGLTRLELPEGVKAILRHVQYKLRGSFNADGSYEHEGHRATGRLIECLTPGDGCYHCNSYFSIYRRIEGTP